MNSTRRVRRGEANEGEEEGQEERGEAATADCLHRLSGDSFARPPRRAVSHRSRLAAHIRPPCLHVLICVTCASHDYFSLFRSVRRLRDELQKLQESGSYIGEVVKVRRTTQHSAIVVAAAAAMRVDAFELNIVAEVGSV